MSIIPIALWWPRLLACSLAQRWFRMKLKINRRGVFRTRLTHPRNIKPRACNDTTRIQVLTEGTIANNGITYLASG